jgi:dienelactone hydrolase
MMKVLFSVLALSFALRGYCSSPFLDKTYEDSIKIEHIEFTSLDGLPISAILYEIDSVSPYIVLCHQARYNKFEYEGIAQRLNALGFNCLAIDQRSGGPISNMVNETTLAAKEAGKPTDYLDAEQDIIAAVNYAANKSGGPIILWGSSYSSTLTLFVALNSKNVRAAIAFSPGDYFIEEKGSLTEKLSTFKKPLFVTSSKREATDIISLLSKMKLGGNQVHFTPIGDGHHGSRALWTHQSDGEEYWEAITLFLEKIK